MTWTELKTYIKIKTSLRFIETIKKYDIWITLDDQKLDCEIYKEDPVSADQTDFETNYKADANSPKMTIDDDTPLKVSVGVMATHLFVDGDEVTHTCTKTEYTFFKSWDLADSYLKGLTFIVEKKESLMKIYRNTTDLLAEVDFGIAEDLMKLSIVDPLHRDFNIYKNDVGVYILKMNSDNTPFDNITVEMKISTTTTSFDPMDLKFRYAAIIYNKVT